MKVSGPGQPAHLLLDVVDLLTELSIPYVLVGGFAVSYHGIPRYTADADAVIWVGGAGKEASDLLNRLRQARYRTELNRGDPDDPISGVIIIKDEHENTVDLILGVRHMDADAVARSISTSLLDSSIRVIAAEDLIPMKIFAGGFQDLEDVKGILQVSGKLLNLDLIRKLARPYGLQVARTVDDLLKEFPPA